MPTFALPTFGTIAVWTALAALIVSIGSYLAACARRGTPGGGAAWARLGRWAFVVAAVSVLSASATLGTLLVTHRFDVQYVYDHSARAMSPLYYFPSFWAGQEGSFLLWGFWIAILGVVLAWTSGAAERRVMPIYGGVLLFLVGMLVVKPPFLPTTDQFGIQVTPPEGLGLNPNLENYWMVIHPPTLFLGFASLTAPFAFALAALLWREWDGWLRRALPWGLFGFAILGLAMMMGGYWAYEMLSWGGFWGWDPVENGPLIPWLFLLGFLHASQIQRVRGGSGRAALTFALLPFVGALYETFLTRTGVLDKFSNHSFSTLGGVANTILLDVLLAFVAVSLGMLLWRAKELKRRALPEAVLDAPASREFGYTAATVILTLSALIITVGLSTPLLTAVGVKLGLATHVATVKEDFYNSAMFPVAVLLALGMGIGPHLAWRGRGAADGAKLVWSYAFSVVAALGFVLASKFFGTSLTGVKLIPQLLLFTASVFAVVANLLLLIRLFPSKAGARSPWTVGGTLSHLGAAVLFLGVVCLVTFVKKDPDVTLVKDRPAAVLDGAYTMVYRGMSGDWQKDKDNVVLFDVASRDGKERHMARVPFALRPVEGGDKMVFGHPAILHHAGGDLYLALKTNAPEEFYKTPVFQPKMKLGDVKQIGPYRIEFMSFDNPMGAIVRATGQVPDVFPVSAVLRVTYKGVTSLIKPQFIQYRNDPQNPKSPEIKMPGGWLVGFAGMNAGSADQANPGAGARNEAASLTLREDSGPPTEAFEVEVTTRPMINLVWIGTLLLVAGGLISMRRRIQENRLVPIPDLAPPAPNAGGAGRAPSSTGNGTRRSRPVPTGQAAGGRPSGGGRSRRAKPAPTLAVPRGKER